MAFGVAESTIWYVLKKTERTGELRGTRRPGRPRKISKWMIAEFFTSSRQVRKTLEEVGLQSRDAFGNVNTDGLTQDANQWEHSRTERPD